MICQNEKTETCVFALSLMKDLMKKSGKDMKPKYVMADNATSIQNACDEVLGDDYIYVTCQQHFRISYKTKSKSNMIGTEKDKQEFVNFAESLLTECQSPEVFSILTGKFDSWQRKDIKRFSHLKNWWVWWYARRYLWSDAFRDAKAAKTNQAEKGNSRYRADLGTTKMDLLKLTETHTFEHLAHVNFCKMFQQGVHIPAPVKRGRSQTLKKIHHQEEKQKMESPVSKKHAEKLVDNIMKNIKGYTQSETESSTSDFERDSNFMDIDADMRVSKVPHPKVGGHKPPEKQRTIYHTTKKSKTKTEREIDTIKSLLRSKPKIVRKDSGKFVFPSNTGKEYTLRLKPSFHCSCPAFKFKLKSNDKKTMCKHIVCTLLIIGVKDEINYYLTVLEESSIEAKIENFTENCIEENISKILDMKEKNSSKQCLPAKPTNYHKKYQFAAKNSALQSLKNDPQHCKWYVTKAESNRQKCPSHEEEANEKQAKGKKMAKDICTGQLVFVAYYQRLLKRPNQAVLSCIGEKRSFHTSDSCITNFCKSLREWSSLTRPTNVKCVGLTNREIENLQTQFNDITFEKEAPVPPLNPTNPVSLQVTKTKQGKEKQKKKTKDKDWLESGKLF